MFQERTSQIRAKLQELNSLLNENKSSIQDKLSKQIANKDEIVERTADSLIKVVNKVRNSLISK